MPISSRAEYKAYLAADAKAHGLEKVTMLELIKRPQLRFQRRLRYVEYMHNCRTGLLWKPYVLFCRWRLQTMGIKLGFMVGLNVCGPGLCLVHWGTTLISPEARIGRNCKIHASTSIASFGAGSPTLGDDVYVGPGAKVMGQITIGDRVTIGANAVVYKSYPSDVTIAAAPSRAFPRPPSGTAPGE